MEKKGNKLHSVANFFSRGYSKFGKALQAVFFFYFIF